MKTFQQPYVPNLFYPDNEEPKLELLEGLLREWDQHFEKNNSAFINFGTDGMVFDGFFPYYFSQKFRILFIGQEAYDRGRCNYIAQNYRWFSKEHGVGSGHINRRKFESRMIKLAYGIINESRPWNDIPRASEIGSTFGKAGGLSFAFMNISKLSNDSGSTKANWAQITTAYRLSTEGRNFIREEVAILEPDIVIGMCLGDDMLNNSLGPLEEFYKSEAANVFRYENAGRQTLVIDTWHFSARLKRAETDYYVPVCSAIQRSKTRS